jgi:hypothetical protein
MSPASNFGFIGEWCGFGEYSGVLDGRAPILLLGPKQDDFAEFAAEPNRSKDVDIPCATPPNDNVPARAVLLERCRALLRRLICHA